MNQSSNSFACQLESLPGLECSKEEVRQWLRQLRDSIDIHPQCQNPNDFALFLLLSAKDKNLQATCLQCLSYYFGKCDTTVKVEIWKQLTVLYPISIDWMTYLMECLQYSVNAAATLNRICSALSSISMQVLHEIRKNPLDEAPTFGNSEANLSVVNSAVHYALSYCSLCLCGLELQLCAYEETKHVIFVLHVLYASEIDFSELTQPIARLLIKLLSLYNFQDSKERRLITSLITSDQVQREVLKAVMELQTAIITSKRDWTATNHKDTNEIERALKLKTLYVNLGLLKINFSSLRALEELRWALIAADIRVQLYQALMQSAIVELGMVNEVRRFQTQRLYCDLRGHQ